MYHYTYDPTNRLVEVENAATAIEYAYNGLGDRLQETMNGVTTIFTMDLNTGLTQALSDGTHTCLYGAGRIAQMSAGGTEYFQGDALGSVRQMVDGAGKIVFVGSYDPYGSVTQAGGVSQSAYGYTGIAKCKTLLYVETVLT